MQNCLVSTEPQPSGADAGLQTVRLNLRENAYDFIEESLRYADLAEERLTLPHPSRSALKAPTRLRRRAPSSRAGRSARLAAKPVPSDS